MRVCTCDKQDWNARPRQGQLCRPIAKRDAKGYVERMDVTPMDALFDEGPGSNLRAEMRAAIARADVIIAVDVATQNEFTVYGTPALEESVLIGKEVALRTLRIVLDERNGELDKLVAVVRAVKRGQDYLAE